MDDRITCHSQQIATFPNFGRDVPKFDNNRIREIIECKYRDIYTLFSATKSKLSQFFMAHNSSNISRSPIHQRKHDRQSINGKAIGFLSSVHQLLGEMQSSFWEVRSAFLGRSIVLCGRGDRLFWEGRSSLEMR